MKRTKTSRFSTALMGVGSVLVVAYFVFAFATRSMYPFNKQNAAAIPIQLPPMQSVQEMPKEQKETLVYGKPVYLTMPEIGLELKIKDGIYNEQTYEWTLSDDAAHYAVMTSLANTHSGNTFIYGHNNKRVFGKLLKTAPNGTKLQLLTDTGKTFVYQLVSYKDVEPTDVSLFSYVGPPIVTIQTCSGNWYEKRRLFTFEFKEVV